MLVTEIAEISQADYNELNSVDSRWTINEYAYWVAKFKSGYPVEGYGCINPRLEHDKNKYIIIWERYNNCD